MLPTFPTQCASSWRPPGIFLSLRQQVSAHISIILDRHSSQLTTRQQYINTVFKCKGPEHEQCSKGSPVRRVHKNLTYIYTPYLVGQVLSPPSLRAILVQIRYLLPYLATPSSSSVSVRSFTLGGQSGNSQRVLCHWVSSAGICHCTYHHTNK